MSEEISKTGVSNKTKQAVLAIATIGSFLTPFMMSALNIALPAIQKEFQADAVLLSWLATSYLLASVVFLPPIGKLADMYGQVPIYRWGIVIFTLFSFASIIVPSIELFILVRILQGIGGSMIVSTGIALLSSIFPPHERGKVLGINVSAVYIGLSMGPFIGGVLTQNLGWLSIFLLVGLLGLIDIFLIFKFIKPQKTMESPEKLDIPGSIIFTLTIVALVYGSSRLPRLSGIILMLAGIAGFILFVKRQLSIPNPVFEIRLFKNNRVFAFSNVAALINYAATSAVTFFLSLYLQYIKALSPQQAGLVLITQPVVQAIISPYAGRLSDKREPALISSLGMGCTALGLFPLIFLQENTAYAVIFSSLFVLGLGFALFSAPNTNAIMGTVEKRYYGIASASVSIMRILGQMLSLTIATLIISLLIGKNPIVPMYYPLFLKSIHISFLIFTILCTAGIFFSFSRGNLHNE